MSKQVRNLAVAVAMLVAPIWANANVITSSGNLAAGDVDYFSFDVTTAGNFTLSLDAWPQSFDPELFLFKNVVANTASNFVASNDDAPGTLDSLLNLFLGTGHYIAAIGAFDLTIEEAVSGSNNWNFGHGAYGLTISSTQGVAGTPRPVSEPGTIGLLGAGLLALALVRRRNPL